MLAGIADLYGRPASAGQTGAGALDSRAAVIPGYGPRTAPDERHGRWGDVGGPASGAPGWIDPHAGQSAYAGDWVLTDDVEDQVPGAEGQFPVDQTPYPQTQGGAQDYSRGRHTGYEPGPAAPAPGYASHAGPYPRTWLRAGSTRPDEGTGLDDQLTEQEARRDVHNVDHGAGRTGWGLPQSRDEGPLNRRDVYYESQGSSDLHRVTEGQIRGTGGGGSGAGGAVGANADEVQGYGVPNRFGYGDAHVQNYRQQTDGVPFNYQWLHTAERPFIPKGQLTNIAAGQTLNHPDSPYGAAGDQTQYAGVLTISPASPESAATAYQAPPDPSIGPAAVSSPDDDVWAWG